MLLTLRDKSTVEVRQFVVGPYAKAGGQHNNGPASVWFRINGGEWIESAQRGLTHFVAWSEVCFTADELLESERLLSEPGA